MCCLNIALSWRTWTIASHGLFKLLFIACLKIASLHTWRCFMHCMCSSLTCCLLVKHQLHIYDATMLWLLSSLSSLRCIAATMMWRYASYRSSGCPAALHTAWPTSHLLKGEKDQSVVLQCLPTNLLLASHLQVKRWPMTSSSCPSPIAAPRSRSPQRWC